MSGPRSGASPSGSQKAIRPSRGRAAGRKTAASRTDTSGSVPTAARVSATLMLPVTPLAPVRPALVGSLVFDSTGRV
ncbi:hypothetical protein ACRJ4B_41145 [Streptomyces sp. GTA36]